MRAAGQGSDYYEAPEIIHHPILPTQFPRFVVSVQTNIGSRRHQEDRFAVCPRLMKDRDDAAFFGVFDGTVGDYASDTVKDLVVPHLLNSPGWRMLEQLIYSNGGREEQMQEALGKAMQDMYANADKELIRMCAAKEKHYASTTSVTVVLAAGLCCVGHLGDSRVALGYETATGLAAEFLTVDHKPDQPEERKRIEASGGSVEYLHNHNNKPFIRGGDFTVRKQAGEQPMQLQYSRAFGGKDLKMFGLSANPDVRIFRLERHHRCLVLASDGLWDIFSAEQAVSIALAAHEDGQNPADLLIKAALSEQQKRNANSDNISTIVVVFK